MLTKTLEQKYKEILAISKDMGLNPFDINYEMVSHDIMIQLCSYGGLPTRAAHWTYGAAYEHQKLYETMGYSKVYEIIINNNPSYAFLLETNREIDNIMIIAHTVGHSHIFKNNVMFQGTDRQMVSNAADRAARVDLYIQEYGIEKVERIMDIAFSLDRHIDPHKGVFRKKYPAPKKEKIYNRLGEFDDLLGKRPTVEYKVSNSNFPPYPEKDILWFLANYAKLEDWEKDILEIIREESYYFYPQFLTKRTNEGLASITHQDIMNRLNLSTQELVDFACLNEKVVQPGSNPYNINPYYFGVKILRHIEKEYGWNKMLEVCATENDISLIRNYLTKDLVEELGLFNYGYKCEENHSNNYKCSKCDYVEVKNKDLTEIQNNLIRPMFNYGVPELAITKINGDLMTITHTPGDFGTLDFKWAEKTLELMFELWCAPIELETVDDKGKLVVLSYDETGFSIISD